MKPGLCKSKLSCFSRPTALPTVESPKGVSLLGSHGTVRESLPSYGSSCLITNVFLHYGYTNFQCANKFGLSAYFCLSHFTLASLYNPFSHFTHFFSRWFS